MSKARLIQVIETDFETRGAGTSDDPVRRIVQYWTVDGKLLAERDEWAEKVAEGGASD